MLYSRLHTAFIGLVPPDSLSVLGQVQFEWFYVFVKAKCGHGPQQVIPIDGLAFFLQTLVAGFGCNEGDELRHALLDCFLGVLGNLGIVRQSVFHNPCNVGYRKIAVLE